MYKKSSSSFVKHLDFLIIDLVLLAGAYVLAFLVRHQWTIPRYLFNPFIQFGIILLIVYLLISLISNAYKDVLHRNKWLELIQTVFQVALTLVILLLYLVIRIKKKKKKKEKARQKAQKEQAEQEPEVNE